MLTTEEVVAEYKSLAGVSRRTVGGSAYIHPYGVDEVHHDENGDDWYIITAFVYSLDDWLLKQCDTNEELCGHTNPHHKFDLYPRYNVHGSLLSYITMKWG